MHVIVRAPLGALNRVVAAIAGVVRRLNADRSIASHFPGSPPDRDGRPFSPWGLYFR
jgi:hypothetical protein